jgi:hypothetical protein
MTDPTARDLIQRLADALDDHVLANWYTCSNLINEARAYLAAPDEPAVPAGREPTVEELRDLWQDLYGALAVIGSSWGGPTRADVAVIARAALARWGSRPPAPIPLFERQPTEADCDAEGRCLLFGRRLLSGEAAWIYGHPAWAQRFADVYSHWLPHWALPAPGVEA